MSIWVPIVSTIAGVVVGGLLGFWGTLKVEQHKRKRLENDFKEGIYAELREAFPRCVLQYCYLNRVLGAANHDTVNWTYSMLSGVRKTSPELTKSLKELSKMSDEKLNALFAQKKDPMPTKSLKKLNLSFLKESISSFSLLEPEFRRSLLGMRTKITWLNEEIDMYYFYYRTTFTSGLTPGNRANLDTNMKIMYKHVAQLSREIAEMIKELM